MTMTTPRRHIEVLTNRRSVAVIRKSVEDLESDSCFDRDDPDIKRPQHSGSPPTSVTSGTPHATTTSQSTFSINEKSQHRKRRRQGNRKGSQRPCQRAHIPLLSIFLLILFFYGVFWKDEPSHQSTNAQFEMASEFSTTSCKSELSTSDVEYTLVTQLSSDRLWMMEYQCSRWKYSNATPVYPISIAVFTNATISDITQILKEMNCPVNIMSIQTLSAEKFSHDNYPVNTLRNLALKGVKTSHVVYIDVDFWISEDLIPALHFPEVQDLLASDPKATLVIPAFQLERQCRHYRECPEKNIPEMPHNYKELKHQILNHNVARFDPTNRGGHGSTRYNDWFKQNKDDGNALIEIDCFLSNRYEPYLVFRLCRELPPFQAPFTGYGKNKMTWVMQLRRMGYSFWQLGKGSFVIHYPHLESASRMAWNNAPENRKSVTVRWQDYKRGQMDQLFVQFRQWLRDNIPDMSRVPFCEDKFDDDAKLWYDREKFKNSVPECA